MTKLDWQARQVEVRIDLSRSMKSKHPWAALDADALERYLVWLRKMEAKAPETPR